MQTRRLLSSISFRIALIFTALLLVSFAIAAAATNFATRSAAIKESRARIAIEAGAIRHEAETEGMAAAIAAVAARAQRPGALGYRIIDPAGRTLAGDDALPTAASGWRTIEINPGGVRERGGDYLLYAEPLAGGVLLVGDDLERAERVRDDIIRTLFAVAGITAAITLIMGLLATRQMLARFASLSTVARAVSEGDLSVRAPPSRGARDDIDEFTEVFNAMLDRVAALVANIRRVSTEVAHDLRTPLAHLGQKLEHARNSPTLEIAKAGVEEAQQSLDHVVRTFAAILRLAEIEAGTLRARFGPVDLGRLAERVTDAYRPDIEGGGRTLAVAVTARVTVNGDSDLLAQALANLIENAIRHTPVGATICVEISASDGHSALVVRDDGPGVPVSDRLKILEPFVRLDSARSGPGAGLGLSIVAAIARLHFGRVEMADASPGLLVRLCLPRFGALA